MVNRNDSSITIIFYNWSGNYQFLIYLKTLRDINFFQTCGQLNEALWLRIYVLLIVIIIPSVLFLSVNGMILFHAHSSSRRIAPSNTTNHVLLANNRDIRLTKRMLILLLLFLFGWCPVYILVTIQNSYSMWVEALEFLAELSLLGEVINLFLYNRKLRLYLKDRIITHT
jgi:uncharacterized membrane protein SpoIIM required for sporulation